MKRTQLAALVLGTALTLGCSDSTGVSLDVLEGQWNATTIQFTNPASAADTVELVAQGGSFTITFTAEGNYTAVTTEPGQTPETITGTVLIEGDLVTLSESGQGSPTIYTSSRNGNTLTLTTTDEEWDFDQDGTDETASLMVVLEKQ